VLKDIKTSTRQRFVAIEFGYPSEETEARIVEHESRVPAEIARQIVLLGSKVRNLREHGFQEGVSTRLLVYTGQLMSSGLAPRIACQSGFVQALTDDDEVKKSISEVVDAIFAD
jgi:nitric oxide reductase NorQ protein